MRWRDSSSLEQRISTTGLRDLGGLLNHGCSDGFSFAGVIFFFNSACCSGVSTSFSLDNVPSWSSFIFALFCSSLSEVSATKAWCLVLASARMSLTFALWSSVRFKLSSAACSLSRRDLN